VVVPIRRSVRSLRMSEAYRLVYTPVVSAW
jgi:hypothetical protein